MHCPCWDATRRSPGNLTSCCTVPHCTSMPRTSRRLAAARGALYGNATSRNVGAGVRGLLWLEELLTAALAPQPRVGRRSLQDDMGPPPLLWLSGCDEGWGNRSGVGCQVEV